MDIFLHCLYAFLVGGFICLIGQVLIDYTKLTPARILVSYVVAGVILTAILLSLRARVPPFRLRASVTALPAALKRR